MHTSENFKIVGDGAYMGTGKYALMDFIKRFQPKDLNNEESRERFGGLASDRLTGNLIVPDDHLVEQGALMFAYFREATWTKELSDAERELLPRLLLDAAWKTRDSKDNSALHYVLTKDAAFTKDDLQMLNVLVAAGKDKPDLLFHPNQDGDTVLHVAIKHKNVQALNLLVPLAPQTLIESESIKALVQQAQLEGVIEAAKERWQREQGLRHLFPKNLPGAASGLTR